MNITDRQERISGFRQSVLDKARIAVIGAGRTGIEVIKNLALTRVGGLLVVDFDHVADTNLPGTVLFDKSMLGESKAEKAAEGYKRMHVGDGVVDFLNADVTYQLGEGVLRRYDIIVNCVDNTETRLWLAAIAKRLKMPCIDTGIGGFDFTLFASSGEADCACYRCLFTPRQEEKALERVRNPCDVTLREAADTGAAATIITSASMVSGMAAEKAIKALHYRERPERAYDPQYGHLVSYFGGKMDIVERARRESCDHSSYDDFGGVIETSLSAENTLREVLLWVQEHYGEGYSLSLRKDYDILKNRAFVTTGFCKHCGVSIEIYRPQRELRDEDILCADCKAAGRAPYISSQAACEYYFSLDSEARVLDMTLRGIGIPAGHIVAFEPEDEDVQPPLFLELTADIPRLIPNLMKWSCV